jgi:WD40 repeat protein
MSTASSTSASTSASTSSSTAAAPSSDTPRTRLYMQKRRSAQIIVDVMTCLDAEKVASIQREFVRHQDNAVDMREFVRIMEDHLSNFGAMRKKMYQGVERNAEEVDEVTRADLLLNLRELFDEIDINGDQLMEWTEFTAFITEKAGLTNAIGLDSITEYRETLRDPSVRRPKKRSKPLQMCYYVQPLDAIAGCDDHSPVVQLYSAENGSSVGQLSSPEVTGMPTAIEYVGKPIVTRYQEPGVLTVACADSSIVSWTLDARSKTNKKQFSVNSAWPTPHTQMSLQWVDRHELLFSGSVAGTVHAWDVENRDEVTCLIGHSDMVLGLANLPTIDSIVSCSLDTTVSVWDILTGSRRQLLQGHKMGVTSVAYQDRRRLLFSAGFDHEALVWSPFTPTVLFKLKGHGSPLVGVEVVPDSNQVVTADTDGLYKIWDVRTFQCVQSFNMDQGSNPTDEGFVATGGGGGGNAPENDEFMFTDHQKLYDFTTCHHRPWHLSENATDRLAGVSLRLAFFEQRPVNVDTGGADDLPVRCAIYNSVLISVLTAHGNSVKIWSALTVSVVCCVDCICCCFSKHVNPKHRA